MSKRLGGIKGCKYKTSVVTAVVHVPNLISCTDRRYFQHAHSIPIVGVGKRGVYELVHGDLPRQHSFGTTLRFTGPVLAGSRQ